MAHRDTSVSELCRELGIRPVTLYRYVGPQGQLREQGQKVLGSCRISPPPANNPVRRPRPRVGDPPRRYRARMPANRRRCPSTIRRSASASMSMPSDRGNM